MLNGTELSSGSIRITDYELQEKMFQALGLTDEEIEAKFGFLVEAYHYGAPPHGGLGIGLDRLAMVMLQAESLRDVVAFPKVQNASELMSACPAPVDAESLDVLGIQVTHSEDDEERQRCIKIKPARGRFPVGWLFLSYERLFKSVSIAANAPCSGRISPYRKAV